MLNSKALAASVSAAPAVYVEDIFSTWLYTGTGSTQTITNGIDLAGKGGLVWTKFRSGSFGTESHAWFDTARGVNKYLVSDGTGAEVTQSNTLTSFNSDGYLLSSDPSGKVNYSAQNYASWTFRKAAKFFDVVTYTGTGSAGRNIAHSLGSAPGFIITKRTDTASNWLCYHRSLGFGNATDSDTNYIVLNSTSASNSFGAAGVIVSADSSTFTPGASANFNGATYVAYIFAHDAGGFGAAGTDNVISCGSFTTGPAGAVVTLGWEPQFILFKASSTTGAWEIIDSMRGAGPNDSQRLFPNYNSAETNAGGAYVYPTSTGFAVSGPNSPFAGDGIYIAIRRGPMKTPTVGTSVYNAITRTGTGGATTVTGGVPNYDLVYTTARESGYSNWFHDRLRGPNRHLATDTTNRENWAGNFNELPEFTNDGYKTGANDAVGLNIYPASYINHFFRRAPGFFDMVAFTSDASGFGATYNHSLGVVPELVIMKARGAAADWYVWNSSLASDKLLYLNRSLAVQAAAGGSGWLSATSSVITVTGTLSNNSLTHISYLFASCPGVSKVGSYTGTGTTLNIDCGFTAGARFVLIKRTDSTGDWFVWDTARGIIGGNDPYLLLNTTDAEVTNTDYIDPLASGFQISSTAPAAINANGGSYIFLSIA